VGSTRTSGLGGADSRAVASATRPTGFAFGLLATVQGTLILTVGVISVLLPAIQRDLGLSDGELALVNTAFGLSFSGLLLLGARVADLVGRRRALRVGMAAFGLASIAAGLAPTLGVLLAARFAEGAGAALAASAAMALLGAVFPDPDRRARAIAIWGGVSSAGALGGVLLSGVFASWASWRWAFAIPVTVAVVAVVAAPRLLPTGPAPLRARLDVPGALLATGGVSALSYGLVTTLDRPWASAMVLVPLPGGAGLLAVFLAVESRVRAPLLPPGFLSAPRRAAALLALLVTVAGIAGSGFIFALYFQQIRGWSALQTSAAFLPYLLILATAVVAGAGRPGRAARDHDGRAGGRRSRPAPVRPAGGGQPVRGSAAGRDAAVPARGGADLRGCHRGGRRRRARGAGRAGRRGVEHRDGARAHGRPCPAGLGRRRVRRRARHRRDRPGRGHHRRLRVRVHRRCCRLRADRGHGRRGAAYNPSDPDRRKHMTARFAGRVALVTGGGTGIGRATALAFAREGATVAVAGRSPDALAQAVQLIETEGGQASAVTADVTQAEDVARLVDTAVARHGGLHIAFNNAGVLVPGLIAEIDEPTWSTVLTTNLTGVWLSMKYEIAHMRSHGGGVIVNTSSIPTTMVPGLGAYGASKAGVSALTRAAAREHLGDGIRVNAICPGPVDTVMSRAPGETDSDRGARMQTQHPMGRVADAGEIAAGVLWLASPESSYTVGHDLVIDGGATA